MDGVVKGVDRNEIRIGVGVCTCLVGIELVCRWIQLLRSVS